MKKIRFSEQLGVCEVDEYEYEDPILDEEVVFLFLGRVGEGEVYEAEVSDECFKKISEIYGITLKGIPT